MSNIKFTELKCRRCGGKLIANGGIYACESCGKTYEKQIENDFATQLNSALDGQKQEQIANIRQLLWKETHEEYISNKEVERLCKEILKYLPEDFYANFYLATCSKSKSALGVFLSGVDIEKYYSDIPDILDYILKALKPEWAMATGNFIERAYKDNDLKMYNKYRTIFEEENEKIEDCVYDTAFPRDVFIAYSSVDMQEVERLADELDKCGLTCFVSARNLRHGSGSADNYEKAIHTAIEHCSVIVFISSDNSRNIKCDAYKELGFIEKNNKSMPRVEYLIKNYSGKATERFFEDFFKGLEYCVSVEDVAQRVCNILMNNKQGAVPQDLILSPEQFKVGQKLCAQCGKQNKENAKFCVYCGSSGLYGKYEDYLKTTYKYCVKCGNSCEKEYKCCPECGGSEFVTYADYLAEQEHLAKDKEEQKQKLLKEEDNARREAERAKLFLKNSQIENGRLIKYNGKDSEIIIPDTVTVIDKSAFANCTLLTSVKLPDSITEIHDLAFYNCSSLKNINLPESLLSIGEKAFHTCRSLISITIPNSVLNVGGYLFQNCESLKRIFCVVQNKPAGWNYYWNSNCSALDIWGCQKDPDISGLEIKDCVLVKYKGGGGKVDVPYVVAAIADSAFEGCETITAVNIGYGVSSIGWCSFSNCTSLKSISIPSSVNSIGNHAFYGCSALTNIYVDDKNDHYKSIDGNLYKEYIEYSLIRYAAGKANSEFVLPNSVTKIEHGAFSHSKSLKSVQLHKKINYIGVQAFDNCTSLNSIIIPKSVTYIGENAFKNCNGLQYIYCAAKQKPSGWDEKWNADCNAKVVWGYKGK